MAAVAPAVVQGQREHVGTQKRLFRSISRFLSGGKARPKLANEVGGTTDERHAVARQSETRPPGRDRPRMTGQTSTGTSTRGARTSLAGTLDDDDSLSRLSAISGADTDASVRPMSPASRAPSSISRTDDSVSNASLAPTHATFKSYASTKPTTLSLDSGAGGGANRIAVVPGTGIYGMHSASTNQNAAAGQSTMPTSSSGHSLSAVHTPSNLSGPGITFDLSNTPPGTANQSGGESTPPGQEQNPNALPVETTKVPRHTQAHPRNNPHPSLPPPDNASMLTLASSSFAPSLNLSRGSERRDAPSATSATGGASTPTPAGTWAGGGLNSLRAWKRGDEVPGADEDASVRALAGSRRASDESLGGTSTWSAAIARSVGGGKENAPSIRTVGTTGTGGGDLNMSSALDRDVTHEGGVGSSSLKASTSVGDIEAAQVVKEAKIGEVIAPTPPSDLTPTEELEAPPSMSQKMDTDTTSGALEEATPHVGTSSLPGFYETDSGGAVETGASTPKESGLIEEKSSSR